MNNSGQAGQLRITKFLLHETGSYNNQFRRSYNTTLTNGTMKVLSERLGGANSYDASMLGGIANQFISPGATPEKEIIMANGWGERRMRFMMEIEYGYYTGNTIKEVILGYTNYNGVGINGSIDPNMEFYINSTLHIRNSVEFTPTGNQTYLSVSDNSHIIVDNGWSGVYDAVKDQRMRPEDVYTTMGRLAIAGIDDGGLCDTRTMSSNIAVKSRRNNGIAADYMAQILNGFSQASTASEFGAGTQDILSKARGLSREGLASKDPFLTAIAQIRGQPLGNVFSFNDLKMIDGNIEHNTMAQLMAPTQKATAHQAGQTEDWGGSGIHTSTANVLSQSVTGMLMELALTRIVFKATNHDIGGAIKVVVYDVQGFSNGDLTRFVEAFKIKLEHEILRDITFDNQIAFTLDMRVDLLGETWVSLSLDNSPVIDYVTPSFADALLTPILTNDNSRATTLANDFDILTATLMDCQSQNQTKSSGMFSPGRI